MVCFLTVGKLRLLLQKQPLVFCLNLELIGWMSKTSSVVIDPDILDGTPCFAGTRVPVRTLLDHLEAGDGLDVFLEDFPTVPRAQAVAFLEESAAAMLAGIPQAA